jgi:hypothetical protein
MSAFALTKTGLGNVAIASGCASLSVPSTVPPVSVSSTFRAACLGAIAGVAACVSAASSPTTFPSFPALVCR